MGYLEINDIKLYYEAKGEGATIVFIHDGLLDSQVWEHQFITFSQTFQVVRYDRRGYGRSGIPAAPFSMVTDLYRLLTHLEISETILLGGSMGGSIALEFTIAYPQMVSKLIVVGASVSGFPFSDHFQQRLQGLVQPLLETDRIDSIIEGYANDPYLIAPGNREAREQLQSLLTKNRRSLKGVQHILKHKLIEPPNPIAFGRLGEVRVPTLIVVGEADIADIHAHAGVTEALISNAKRIVVPDAGHLVYLEKPEVFNQIILQFLSDA